MARKSGTSLYRDNGPWSSPAPKIHLTLTQGLGGELAVGVAITEFIAYAQNPGFTRLNLTGGKILEVKETTDQIDRLVRAASSQPNQPPRPSADKAPALLPGDNPVMEPATGMEKQGEFPGMTPPSTSGLDPLLAVQV
jgi:hypothetical protein